MIYGPQNKHRRLCTSHSQPSNDPFQQGHSWPIPLDRSELAPSLHAVSNSSGEWYIMWQGQFPAGVSVLNLISLVRDSIAPNARVLISFSRGFNSARVLKSTLDHTSFPPKIWLFFWMSRWYRDDFTNDTTQRVRLRAERPSSRCQKPLHDSGLHCELGNRPSTFPIVPASVSIFVLIRSDEVLTVPLACTISWLSTVWVGGSLLDRGLAYTRVLSSLPRCGVDIGCSSHVENPLTSVMDRL
ncbi:hypothetical protein VTO42DRAFT_5732 [Malbranchea cinnamomea]